MTPLKSPISRRTNAALDGSFGPDRNRRLVVTLVPAAEDMIELRPEGTRRREIIAVADVYRYALRCRINRDILEKARAKKAKKQAASEQRKYKAKLRR